MRESRNALLILSVALAACGSFESGEPTAVRIASPNPTSSSTPQPSATPTASPSPSATPSATPETLIRDHPDGSQSFMDLKFGYSIDFPPGWNILSMTERQSDEAFSAALEEFPDLRDRIGIFSLASPEIRIFALVDDPHMLALENPPIMGVLISESPSSLSLDLMLSQTVQALDRFFEAEISSSEIITNSKGVTLGITTYRFGPANDIDFLASTYGNAALFYIEGTLVTITGNVNQALGEELEPIFDTILDNVEIDGLPD